MKTFINYIQEASYIRFLNKNKNLTKAQRKEINDFFSKKSPHAGEQFGRDFDWQSKRVREMLYDEFKSYIMSTTAGRKSNIKQIKIPGSKGKDYWPMKLKNKKFIANIPLNWETAQYMNSCNYGTINVNYCIGWASNVQYWDEHVILEQKVPIYITDGIKKWVVMILPGNKKYEVWDKFNSHDIAKSDPEPILGFSIKKELIGSRQSKLYDEIRDDFYKGHSEYQYLVDEYKNYNNNLYIETTDKDIIKWFENQMDARWFVDCDISFNNDQLNIELGSVSSGRYSIHDSGELIVKITGCVLSDGIFDLSEHSDSRIFGCSILNNCKVEYTLVDDCKLKGKSYYKRNTIYGGIIDEGEFKFCDVLPYIINGGTFSDCIIKPQYSSRRISIVKNIIVKNSDMIRVDVYEGTYKNVSFKNCIIHGGTFDDKCEFDEHTPVNKEINKKYNINSSNIF